MTDYDIFIKELIDEATRPDGELHGLARKCYEVGYEHGKQSAPKGLPGVTSGDIYRQLTERWDDRDTVSLAYALEEWFNDPDRDTPVKQPMHPDLEWLTKQPARFFQGCLSPQPVRFYRADNEVRFVVYDGSLQSAVRRPTFTLAEIEQARRYLARTPDAKTATRHPDVSYSARRMQQLEAESAQANAERMSVKAERLRQLEAERDANLLENLGLYKLPDYVTWFEKHGKEETAGDPFDESRTPEATVNELYTHFRARLLDELQQAGVIGNRSEW